MAILADLLKKAPQSIKDKYKIKVREKAIERVKQKISGFVVLIKMAKRISLNMIGMEIMYYYLVQKVMV